MIDADARSRLQRYKILIGGFGILLIIVTGPLWGTATSFPDVPLLRGLPLLGSPTEWPRTVDAVALVTMLVGLGAIIAGGLRPRLDPLALLYPVGFVLAVLLDQHRLQPWAYQFAALTILLCGHPAGAGLRSARILAVGIYLWSAIGKFDFQFAYTVGAEMFATVLAPLGVDIDSWPSDRVAAAALLLPLGELLAAVLLVVPRTRRAGVVLSVAMHAGLIGILGPWGLHHQAAVLLWNGFFIGQAYLLFWPSAARRAEGATEGTPNAVQPRSSMQGIQIMVLLLVLGLPALERFGYFDHWPSWALYAPHSSRATILVTHRGLDSLPPDLAALAAAQADPSALFVSVPIDRWSLDSLRVPIYPQARFQLGVAIALARRGGLDREIVVHLRGPADRWTGRRQAERLHGLPDLLRAADRFRFGALPREPNASP